jgi:small subunit ribosomal protein S17
MTAGKGLFGGRRVLEGTVVSDKSEKTVVVAVNSSVRHPLYKKIVRRMRKFMAHDDELNAHMGDVVRIVESRPMSKRKRWRVIEVLSRADLPEVAAESIDLELLGEVKSEEEPTEDVAAVTTADEPPSVEGEALEAEGEQASEAEGSLEADAGVQQETEAEAEAVEDVVPEAAGADEAEDVGRIDEPEGDEVETVEEPAEASEETEKE